MYVCIYIHIYTQVYKYIYIYIYIHVLSMFMTGAVTFNPHVRTTGIVNPSSKSTSVYLDNLSGAVLSIPIKI